MTIYIGIDAAKTFHVACAINSQGQVLTRFRFENDAAGFQEFHQTMQCLCPQEGGNYSVAWNPPATMASPCVTP